MEEKRRGVQTHPIRPVDEAVRAWVFHVVVVKAREGARPGGHLVVNACPRVYLLAEHAQDLANIELFALRAALNALQDAVFLRHVPQHHLRGLKHHVREHAHPLGLDADLVDASLPGGLCPGVHGVHGPPDDFRHLGLNFVGGYAVLHADAKPVPAEKVRDDALQVRDPLGRLPSPVFVVNAVHHAAAYAADGGLAELARNQLAVGDDNESLVGVHGLFADVVAFGVEGSR